MAIPRPIGPPARADDLGRTPPGRRTRPPDATIQMPATPTPSSSVYANAKKVSGAIKQNVGGGFMRPGTSMQRPARPTGESRGLQPCGSERGTGLG